MWNGIIKIINEYCRTILTLDLSVNYKSVKICCEKIENIFFYVKITLL